MNKLLAALALTAGVTLTPLVSPAQERQGCFMLDESGREIDLGSLCGSSAPTYTPGLYRVPIKRRVSGIPVVDARFNGGETYEMLFDTGASSIVISRQMAKDFGLCPVGVARVNTPSQNNVRMPVARPRSVEVGGVEASNPVVIVSPSLSMGLLGQNFFGEYDVTIKESVIELRAR